MYKLQANHVQTSVLVAGPSGCPRAQLKEIEEYFFFSRGEYRNVFPNRTAV
jgi:hypothetical protein